MITGGNGRTPSAETQQFALAALLKVLINTILVHLLTREQVVKVIGQSIADLTLHAAASIAGAIAENSEMTITAVATIIDNVVIWIRLRVEKSVLIFE